MREVFVPVLDVAAALLVVSGTVKLRRPEEARAVLRQLGLPAAAVAAVAALELGVGLTALLVPRPPVAAAVAALYVTFALVVERLRAVGAAGSCGCLGARSAPPSRVHTALDLALAAGAGVAAAWPSSPLVRLVALHPLTGAACLLGVAAATALAAAALTDLPTLLGAYRAEPR